MYFNILLGKSVLLCCIYILINTLDYNSSSYSHIAIHSDYYTTFKNKIIYQKNERTVIFYCLHLVHVDFSSPLYLPIQCVDDLSILILFK